MGNRFEWLLHQIIPLPSEPLASVGFGIFQRHDGKTVKCERGSTQCNSKGDPESHASNNIVFGFTGTCFAYANTDAFSGFPRNSTGVLYAATTDCPERVAVHPYCKNNVHLINSRLRT